MTTRFCLIRHGETDWNADKRIQGHIDIDLNAHGEAQALAVRPGLAGQQFDAVYSSDLVRAWRTALLATEGLGLPAVSPAPTLRERHYGIYQGLTAAEALARHPEVHRHHAARRLDYDYETGESLIDFAVRIMDGLTEFAVRHAGGAVLAFTHGGVLDVIYRAATGRDLESSRDFTIPNAALNWLEFEAGEWRMQTWGDRRHLERTLDEVADYA
jgi:probable phosphoglycerate mutase